MVIPFLLSGEKMKFRRKRKLLKEVVEYLSGIRMEQRSTDKVSYYYCDLYEDGKSCYSYFCQSDATEPYTTIPCYNKSCFSLINN